MGLMEWIETAAIAVVVGAVYILRRQAAVLAEIQSLRQDVKELRVFIDKNNTANSVAVVDAVEGRLNALELRFSYALDDRMLEP